MKKIVLLFAIILTTVGSLFAQNEYGYFDIPERLSFSEDYLGGKVSFGVAWILPNDPYGDNSPPECGFEFLYSSGDYSYPGFAEIRLTHGDMRAENAGDRIWYTVSVEVEKNATFIPRRSTYRFSVDCKEFEVYFEQDAAPTGRISGVDWIPRGVSMPALMHEGAMSEALTSRQWQKCTSGSWQNIQGATDEGCSPGVLTESTLFRIKLNGQDAYCEEWVVELSDHIGRIITPIPAVGPGKAPGKPMCHDYCWESSLVSRQWQQSTDGRTWTDIPGATEKHYLPGPLSYPTHYRIKIDGKNSFSLETFISIGPGAGAISGDQTILHDCVPNLLKNIAAASGGDGTHVYQWQSSTDNTTWNDIPDANGLEYQPPMLNISTRYRRSATYGGITDYSNTVSVLITGSIDMALSKDNNYILNIRHNDDSAHNTTATVDYYDGLGRLVQTIAVGASPTGDKDIVSFTEYDNMGRTSKSDLPFVLNANKGAMANNPILLQQSYYTDKYGSDGTYAFTSTTYENAPTAISLLSRGAGITGNEHPVKTGYRNYSGTDITKYEVLSGNPIEIRKSQYPSGTLLERTTSIVGNDPDQAHLSYEYVNSKGQVVAILDGQRDGTYYAYDVCGRLVATIPQNVHINLSGNISEEDMTGGCSLNHYDGSGNLMWSSNPGSDPVISTYV